MIRLFALLLILGGVLPCVAQPGPLPSNYKTILTNRSFRVIYVHYGPHEKVPVHDHPDTPTVYVYLNDSSPVRISHEEEAKPFSIVRPPTKTGAFRVSSGRIERHSIENLGDLESNFLRVELLDIRLGEKDLEFRGPAPSDASHNLSATEFSSPHLEVARTICSTPAPCVVKPSVMTSVIIAISTSIINIGDNPTPLKPGEVMSIAPDQSFAISPSGNTPAHILQVLVPAASPTKP